MKNLLIIVIMLVFAGISFAQSVATANQLGNTNSSSIQQTGSNEAVTDQINGDGNKASIKQNGSNDASIIQGMKEDHHIDSWGPTYTSSNLAGNNNVASIEQIGGSVDMNNASVTQVGDNNQSAVKQDGNDNTVYSYQGWAYSFWGETAITSNLASSNSKVKITQVHDGNYGAVWQYGGDDNEVNISQTGNSNVASVAQGFIYDDAPYNFSRPVYNTNDNFASITQENAGNSAKLFQLGNSNSFKLTQSGDDNTVGGRGLSGLAAIRNGYFEQDGNSNKFVGIQTDGATLDHESFQAGDFNDIDLSQGAADGALIKQDGDWNTANVYQYGGGNSATALQTGSNNTSTITQK